MCIEICNDHVNINKCLIDTRPKKFPVIEKTKTGRKFRIGLSVIAHEALKHLPSEPI